jgi:hypothetical protein
MAHFLPTRLVYVGTLSLPELRIHTTKPSEVITYSALSHCWGTKKIETLTMENQDAWSRNIEIAKLSANFQDAIHFTRSIGQLYVWIDSMCIIQNCTQDWAREAVKMSRVYSQAYCTISASGSVEADGGCFQTRNPLLNFPCNLLFSNNDALVIRSTEPFGTYHGLPGRKTPLRGLFGDEVDASPLSKRAWAFQERLLSKRIVHFGGNYLFFECNIHFASEQLQGGQKFGAERQSVAPNHVLTDWLSLLLSKFAGRKEKKSPTSSVCSSRYNSITEYRAAFDLLRGIGRASHSPDFEQQVLLHQNWFDLVAKFTSANLTNTDDRLIAIYGIAHAIEEPGEPPNYMAGLWRKHLLYDLLWHLDARPLPRPKLRRAPSWSWGGIDGKVCQYLFTPSSNIDYRDDRKHEGFSIVSGAEVRGVEMQEHGTGTASGRIDLHCFILDIVDVMYHKVDRNGTSSLLLKSDNQSFLAKYVPDDTTSDPTVCIELVRCVKFFGLFPEGRWVLETHGLALRPVSLDGSRSVESHPELADDTRKEYERVGRYKAEWHMGDKDVSAFRKTLGDGHAGGSNNLDDLLGALRDSGKGYFADGAQREVRLI